MILNKKEIPQLHNSTTIPAIRPGSLPLTL